MAIQQENPGAIAVAHRADVTKLEDKNDIHEATPTPLDLQVRKVIALTKVSPSLAVAIAVLAFSSGRPA